MIQEEPWGSVLEIASCQVNNRARRGLRELYHQLARNWLELQLHLVEQNAADVPESDRGRLAVWRSKTVSHCARPVLPLKIELVDAKMERTTNCPQM